ncbi:esterase [Mycobacterium sp. GA-1285]|uniref:alpha/beta fold hydrolase n=1 Tax=Mycobacterium sp. GA-1285 TaxID=1772282 RepID=UPI0007483883|nr:alpha/beta hydrolase [Mycobacterium sp. GA-1285]KUI20229.1 esterase [Mycobacterium sp. GA-1285]
MALPALVLVHGGGLAADSWELTIDEIYRQEPELPVLAVDLPGRRGKSGDLLTLTIADFVESVVRDIENAGFDEVVIAGHSMAGLTVPGVVTELGSSRVREMILIAAFVPPEGQALVDTITGMFARIARRRAKRSTIAVTPSWMVRIGFLNGTTSVQRRFMAGKLYPESPHILTESVSREAMPDDIPRTWVMTRRDRALSHEFQRNAIDAIGGVQTTIEMGTCHMPMVSEPARLAEILVERCRRYR